MAGIYIHIPFCKQKCHYCSFHFSTTFEKYRRRMINAILTEIELDSTTLDEQVETIYFGGGTPSLLSEKELNSILSSIQKNYKVLEKAEITLEANPDDITKEKAQLWNKIGINRLSIGVQSFFDEDLKMMNRAHNSNQANTAIQIIKEIGFTNYSVDLMFALPELSNKNWINNLNTLIELKAPHLSCYNLTIEEQSALVKMIKKGKIPSLSESKSLQQFDLLMKMMSDAGYEQYEISNFCLPDFKSKHNSAYWNQIPYLGFGPSAHSFINGNRYFNVAHNMNYIKGVENKTNFRDQEFLSNENRFNEYILTKLRCSEGISNSFLRENFPSFLNQFTLAIQQQKENETIQITEDAIKLTKKGKFIADQVAMELFV